MKDLFKPGDVLKKPGSLSSRYKIIGFDKHNYICEIIFQSKFSIFTYLMPQLAGEKTGEYLVLYKGSAHRHFKKVGMTQVFASARPNKNRSSGCIKFIPPSAP